MSIRTQFALIFLVGLFLGIVVESHVLGNFRQSQEVSLDSGTHSVGSRSATSDLPASGSEMSGSARLADAPKISVDEPSFDFGDRDTGTMVQHAFTIKNEGQGTLSIDRVLTSCSCTSANLPTKSIPPGGSVELSVKLDLGSQRGAQNRSILVQSNDPDTPNLRLALVGNAIYHVALSPSRVTLGEATAAEPFTTTVSVRADKTVGEFNVNETQTSGDNVTAEVEPLEPGKHYVVRIKVTRDGSGATSQGWVRLLTDHPGEYKLINIPILSPEQPIVSDAASTYRPPVAGPTLNASVGGTLELDGAGLDGDPLNLTNYEGKLTAVVFWASSCSACRNELGELKQLHADYRDQGFEIVGVSLDKSIERRQQFLDELQLPFKTLVSQEDGTGISFARRYSVTSIPSVVLLDRSGKIIAIDKRGDALRQEVSEHITPSDGA
jgi:peroxiredoxin